MSCVYGLFSTKEPEQIRYIGISKHEDADKRLAVHLSSARNDKRLSHLPVYRWINKHESEGFSIGYIIINDGLSWEEACFLEIENIKDYRLLNNKLLNMTDGGEGFLGGSHSEESREKMRAYWTFERREQQRERTKSRPIHVFTEDQLEKMKQSATKRHHKLRESGLIWGLDVGPKDKTPSQIKERIVEERKSGRSYGQISSGLNKDQVPTANGGKWYPTSVKNIYDRQNLE
jgi:hypothetical protein